MGERAAYKTLDSQDNWCDDEVWLRKQWYRGDSKLDVEAWVREIAEQLLDGTMGEAKINAGGVALRNDLTGGRLARAMVMALSSRPFDQIRTEKPGDISNHGIFEIELISWDLWHVNHIPVKWHNLSDTEKEGEEVMDEEKETIACVKFTSGETLEDGMEFGWLLDENKVYEFRH